MPDSFQQTIIIPSPSPFAARLQLASIKIRYSLFSIGSRSRPWRIHNSFHFFSLFFVFCFWLLLSHPFLVTLCLLSQFPIENDQQQQQQHSFHMHTHTIQSIYYRANGNQIKSLTSISSSTQMLSGFYVFANFRAFGFVLFLYVAIVGWLARLARQ